MMDHAEIFGEVSDRRESASSRRRSAKLAIATYRAEIDRLRAEIAALRQDAEQCRAALAELVACKDLQKRTEALHFAGPLSTAGEGWEAEYEAGRKEYLRRQPAAWEAARAAMAKSAQCRTDGRCQYAIDHGAEGLGHCPAGKCVMARSAA